MYSTSSAKENWKGVAYEYREHRASSYGRADHRWWNCRMLCALTVRENSDYKIIIAEKANIKRSGCLAAGVNAINAYIVKGRKPEDYVEYAKKDADNIVREDLLLTMSEGLNRVTAKMEQLGLVILRMRMESMSPEAIGISRSTVRI